MIVEPLARGGLWKYVIVEPVVRDVLWKYVILTTFELRLYDPYIQKVKNYVFEEVVTI